MICPKMKQMIWGWTNKPASLTSIKNCVGYGWGKILEELIEKLNETNWDGVILQVKEKFGELRFYIGKGNEEIWNLIDKYEEKSYHICEICGEPGRLYDIGWWKTLCEKCAKESGKID